MGTRRVQRRGAAPRPLGTEAEGHLQGLEVGLCQEKLFSVLFFPDSEELLLVTASSHEKRVKQRASCRHAVLSGTAADR